MNILTTVQLQDYTYSKREIIFDFSNDRHHAIQVEHGVTPKELIERLENLVHNLKKDIKSREL